MRIIFADSVAPLDSKPSCFFTAAAALYEVCGWGENVPEQKTKTVAWHHC